MKRLKKTAALLLSMVLLLSGINIRKNGGTGSRR